MEPLQLADKLRAQFPEDVLEVTEFRGQASVILKKDRIVEVCRWLRDEPELSLDHLRDITAVDWLGRKLPRFEVVYHLYSLKHRHMIRLKAQVSEEDCSIDTVTPLWSGAGWHERECYDLFGVVFTGHGDLRRILLPEDWEGHPLRKDYPTMGPPPEQEWPGFKEVLKKAETYKEFEWER
ncbi:MAG: NADH-quinone oxidoreductase subunit C [Nitrospirota bacterium]|jgi:NADH-quinone oxidoreductase subunit C